MKPNDLTGKKFGMLIVLGLDSFFYDKSGHKRSKWKVKCDCGVEKVLITSNFAHKHAQTVSCGCYHLLVMKKGVKKRNPESAILNHYSQYKAAAKADKREFLLEFEYFKELTKNNCDYCGEKAGRLYRDYRGNGEREYVDFHGVDRVDSKIGYIMGNVVSCCTMCNYGKNTMTPAEFRSQINSIYNFFVKPQNDAKLTTDS